MDHQILIEELRKYKFSLVEKNNCCSDEYLKNEYHRKYITTMKMIKILEEEK